MPRESALRRKPPDFADAARLLLAWYNRGHRDLPWRARAGAKADPYAVWLSEIMLQQTGVKTVAPYFERFMSRWPDVASLAAASLEDVLREWAGLGYYSRARNLHGCAIRVVDVHGGRFPADEAGLRELPGIGAYTAAAISAIAFGRRAVVIDGNVERVVSRIAMIETPLPAAKPAIFAVADELTPADRCGDFAQAMMDLGATLCTPRNPLCSLCPFAELCRARREGNPEDYPRKIAKAVRPSRSGAIFFARRDDGSVLVRTRPPRGLLGGMTEFPGTAWGPGSDAAGHLEAAPLAGEWRKVPGAVTHVFTHFALSLTVYAGDFGVTTKTPDGCRWVSEKTLSSEALPTLMRKVAVHAKQIAPK